MEVRLSDDAETDAARIDAWWRENRPAAPDLFWDELQAVIALLRTAPEAGAVIRRSGDGPTRRTLLKKTRHYAYHRIENGEVMIIAIWGNPRGKGPPLALR